LEENFLSEIPGTVFIGISQGGAIVRSDAQMFQFVLTAS
jgi:hypothetical protein